MVGHKPTDAARPERGGFADALAVEINIRIEGRARIGGFEKRIGARAVPIERAVRFADAFAVAVVEVIDAACRDHLVFSVEGNSARAGRGDEISGSVVNIAGNGDPIVGADGAGTREIETGFLRASGVRRRAAWAEFEQIAPRIV